jgi:glycine/D-amino acid oxidase-like deaminating enzyme
MAAVPSLPTLQDRPRPEEGREGVSEFSPREEKIVRALSAAAMPQGPILDGGGETTLRRLVRWLAGAKAVHWAGLKALLWSAELASVPFTGRPFSSLPPERAARFLESWSNQRSPRSRALLRAVLSPLKAAHFDDPKMKAHVGCKTALAVLPVAIERPRFLEQVTDGSLATEDLELECEVVVVGTGAGGAACAYELASRGRAVLMLEEGRYHRRDAFNSRATLMSRMLYRDQGLTIALGNANIPLWAGRAVGGSTVINSGTCYRANERIFRRWRGEGLGAFSAETLAPYYERVEQMLQVTRAKKELMGGVGRVVARGADSLGYRHAPLMRNAPDCDGQGVCCFGCPTGAKRSTDVSYVPEALKRGAQLVTSAKVTRIDVEGRTARGVEVRLGSGKRLKVRAEAVVVAGGALMTPLILAGVVKSPALGHNLSIHPATKVMAVFDELIDMDDAIPQGYSIEQFQDEGMMFEGASTPLDITAVAVPWVGRRFMDLMEAYRHVATFGFMIEDTSRGRVRTGPSGSPLITYDLNADDTAKMKRGIGILSELFFASGAKRVLPMVAGMEELTGAEDLAKLRAMKLRPGDFEVTAYHPLGTCRIGVDPRTSVLGPDHETHEVSGLYVTDGSAIPSALGVNPQMTIMAMALRAAEGIDARLS